MAEYTPDEMAERIEAIVEENNGGEQNEPAAEEEARNAPNDAEPSVDDGPDGDAGDPVDDGPGENEAGNANTSKAGDGEELDPELKARAERLGFSEEDFETFGPNLEAAVAKFERLHDERILKLGAKPQAETAPATPKEEQPAKAETPAPAAPVESVVQTLLDDGGYEEDEPIVQVVKSLEAQNRALMERLDGIERAAREDVTQAQAMQLVNETEAFFAGVGEEFKDLVGEGSTFEMEEGSASATFRKQMIESMAALDAGYRQSGIELSVKELGQKALNMLAADHARNIERKKIAKSVKKRQSSASTPPSRRDSAPMSELSKDDHIRELAGVMDEVLG